MLDGIKAAWREDRKPANVLLVVDTSGSMGEEDRLEQAKQGLEAFFREVSPNDRVGLTIFSDRHPAAGADRAVPPEPGASCSRRCDSLIADGGTAVYDATHPGLRDRCARWRDRERINAVVVLTDGEDTDSSASAPEVVAALRAQGDSANQVRVFTIAYSAGAAGAARGARARSRRPSGGQPYEGDTEDIESVYKSISSFF